MGNITSNNVVRIDGTGVHIHDDEDDIDISTAKTGYMGVLDVLQCC